MGMTTLGQNSAYAHWFEILSDPRFSPSSKAIQDYLRLTDGLESPTPYHIWSFISLIGALCGSKIKLKYGPVGKQSLNFGIVLSGVSAIRKSSALSVMQKFAQGLPISYGPNDTSGQRQGLMSAMLPRWQHDAKAESAEQIHASTLEELSMADTDSVESKLDDPLSRPASEIYFVAKELGRLLSSPTRELLDFFTDAMDGESIHYKLKNQETRINKPLVSLIGATTPGSLGHMLPRGAADHGFLSRIIFVHASTLAQSTPIVKEWGERENQIKDELHSQIMDALVNGADEVRLSESAEASYIDLYGYAAPHQDARFGAYIGRRSGHLLRLAAVLGLLRGGSEALVIASDIRLAHALLVMTEMEMERAFYGLDSGFYSKALNAFADVIQSSPTKSASSKMIQIMCGHIGNNEEIDRILDSLVNQKKLNRTRDSGEYTFNDEAAVMSFVQLKKSYRGNPESDQFVQFKSELKIVKTEKGG